MVTHLHRNEYYDTTNLQSTPSIKHS